MTWSLSVDQSERGCVRWTSRGENAWSVPRSNALITSDCDLGVSQKLLYMVQAVEHRSRAEPPSDNHVGRLEPKKDIVGSSRLLLLASIKGVTKSTFAALRKNSFVNPIFEA